MCIRDRACGADEDADDGNVDSIPAVSLTEAPENLEELRALDAERDDEDLSLIHISASRTWPPGRKASRRIKTHAARTANRIRREPGTCSPQ